MTPALYIRYNPGAALVECMDVPVHAELAHRRLADWTWANRRAPRSSPHLLATIARCSPAGWRRIARALADCGWREVKGLYTNRRVMQALRLAINARRAAAASGELGNRVRWADRDPIAPRSHRDSPPDRHPIAPRSHRDRTPIAPRSPLTKSTLGTLQSINVTEHLMRSALLPKGQLAREKDYLNRLREMVEKHRKGSGNKELQAWGGWFRLRFREEPDKSERILAEISGMLRERKLLQSPGAAFYDLWQRWPGTEKKVLPPLDTDRDSGKMPPDHQERPSPKPH